MGLTFKMEDEPDLTVPEDTIFQARLEEIKQKTINWNDKQTGQPKSRELLEFWWVITSNNAYGGRKVRGECPAKLGNASHNKFAAWAQAILDREIPLNAAIDTDDLLGRSAQITIRHEKDRKDPSRVYERVDEVMPADGSHTSVEPPF